MRKIVLCLLVLVLGVVTGGCGVPSERTKAGLIENAVVHEKITVKGDYQEAYKKIDDKIGECFGYTAQSVHHNLYPNLNIGEFYTQGVLGEGFVFLVVVAKDTNDETSVNLYSTTTSGQFPKHFESVLRGAQGLPGCGEGE